MGTLKLLHSLRDRFGIGGTALEWFSSYLSYHKQVHCKNSV